MINILVTGGNGQLGLCIKDLSENLSGYNFIFLDFEDLDITNEKEVNAFFSSNSISYCVNCAAFTNVDKSESEEETSKKVNQDGVKFLAETCKKNNTILIQISTDFVFDGNQSIPYKENDKTNPLSVYGLTKLNGEVAVASVLDKYFILRTSWLYSEYGNNFLKTMLRLSSEKEELSIISDQIGTPTYAGDLAELILKIIKEDSNNYGLYHFSNQGVASWYDFAKAIFDINSLIFKVNPIKTEEYKTDAERPKYSILDKSKVQNTFNLEIPYWRESLKKAIVRLKILN